MHEHHMLMFGIFNILYPMLQFTLESKYEILFRCLFWNFETTLSFNMEKAPITLYYKIKDHGMAIFIFHYVNFEIKIYRASSVFIPFHFLIFLFGRLCIIFCSQIWCIKVKWRLIRIWIILKHKCEWRKLKIIAHWNEMHRFSIIHCPLVLFYRFKTILRI